MEEVNTEKKEPEKRESQKRPFRDLKGNLHRGKCGAESRQKILSSLGHRGRLNFLICTAETRAGLVN